MSNLYKQETWSVYESNVQAYRSNFLSSQSLLLAAGAIMYEKNNYVFWTIALVALIQMWYIWFFVIKSRIYIADFHKYDLYKYFDNEGKIIKTDIKDEDRLNEKIYASKKDIRLKVNTAIPRLDKIENYHDYNGKFTNFRLTRLKIDILIPITLTVIWGAFIVLLYI